VEGGTGLGKPLKTIVHPFRAEVPIYLAAIGPKNVALAGEIADGWLPTFFAPAHAAMFEPWLGDGLSRAGRDRATFDVSAFAMILMGDDLQACRDMAKPMVALYVGGMGAQSRNFYNDLVVRYGYDAEAAKIQELFLEGRKGEAAAAVPDALVDEVALVGPRDRIADQLEVWKGSGVDTLIVGGFQIDALRALAELTAD
jgi:F420-dependent oxidoreductase-like protein